MKIGWRAAESLFAQDLLGHSEIVGVSFKLRQLAHQRQQFWNIGFD
jgi:hypothetical protein